MPQNSKSTCKYDHVLIFLTSATNFLSYLTSQNCDKLIVIKNFEQVFSHSGLQSDNILGE